MSGKKNKGWRGESKRHSLAAQGVSTKTFDDIVLDDANIRTEIPESPRLPSGPEKAPERKERNLYNATNLSPSGYMYAYDPHGKKVIGLVDVGTSDDGDIHVLDSEYIDSRLLKDGSILKIYKIENGTIGIKSYDGGYNIMR